MGDEFLVVSGQSEVLCRRLSAPGRRGELTIENAQRTTFQPSGGILEDPSPAGYQGTVGEELDEFSVVGFGVCVGSRAHRLQGAKTN